MANPKSNNQKTYIKKLEYFTIFDVPKELMPPEERIKIENQNLELCENTIKKRLDLVPKKDQWFLSIRNSLYNKKRKEYDKTLISSIEKPLAGVVQLMSDYIFFYNKSIRDLEKISKDIISLEKSGSNLKKISLWPKYSQNDTKRKDGYCSEYIFINNIKNFKNKMKDIEKKVNNIFGGLKSFETNNNTDREEKKYEENRNAIMKFIELKSMSSLEKELCNLKKTAEDLQSKKSPDAAKTLARKILENTALIEDNMPVLKTLLNEFLKNRHQTIFNLAENDKNLLVSFNKYYYNTIKEFKNFVESLFDSKISDDYRLDLMHNANKQLNTLDSIYNSLANYKFNIDTSKAKIYKDQLNESCIEILNHSKIMNGLINNLKNEIDAYSADIKAKNDKLEADRKKAIEIATKVAKILGILAIAF